MYAHMTKAISLNDFKISDRKIWLIDRLVYSLFFELVLKLQPTFLIRLNNEKGCLWGGDLKNSVI